MVHSIKLKNTAFSKIKRNMSGVVCASAIFFATSCGEKTAPGPDHQALYFEQTAFANRLIPKSSKTYEQIMEDLCSDVKTFEFIKKEGKANFRGDYNQWGFKQEAIEAGFLSGWCLPFH